MSTTRSVFDVLDPEIYGLPSARRFGKVLFAERTQSPRRTLVLVVSVSIAVAVFTGLFFYQARAQFAAPSSLGGAVMNPSSGKVYLNAQVAAAATAMTGAQRAPTLELHIANNGLVLLEGARVVSLSGGRIRVEMAWGAASFTWVTNTNSNTKYFSSNGEKTPLGRG